jgi:transposase
LKDRLDVLLHPSGESFAVLGEIDRDIDKMIRDSPARQAEAELLHSAPGTGPATRRTLIAEAPEPGPLTRRKIAALVGRAPINRASGARRGRRAIPTGQARGLRAHSGRLEGCTALLQPNQDSTLGRDGLRKNRARSACLTPGSPISHGCGDRA